MYKQLLLCSLLLSSGVVASARSLSPSEALARVPGMVMSRSAFDATPVLTVGSAEAPTVYVFNRPDEGWMIVSADDVAAPVLGYSDQGSISSDNMPDNFKGWLELYGEQISSASLTSSEPYRSSRAIDDRSPINPLVETRWNQGVPYNLDCPKVGNLSTYTGCVATAMAQIMKYHNWPPKAGENATFSYKVDNVTYSADFKNFEFDWDNMLNVYETYSTEQADAVAKLMQACGYSILMRYGTYASAAYNEMVGNALVTYYDYDYCMHNEYRSLYASAEWEDMIYDNLVNYGPMVYWGGAHCFVCDGYDKNGYFHFNWGWGGSQDGYFLMSALAPGAGGIGSGTGDYTLYQGALLGIKPSTGTNSQKNYTFIINSLDKVNTSGDILTIYGDFNNNSSYTVNAKMMYEIYNEDGTEKIATCPTYTAWNGWGIDISTGNTVKGTQMMGSITGVADGNYRVYPAVEVDGTVYPFHSSATIAGYIDVTLVNGKILSAVIPSTGSLIIEDLKTFGDFYEKSKIRFSGVAKFTGNGDTNVSIYACLLRADGSVRANCTSPLTINFSPEGTPFEYTLAWFDNDRSQAVEPGEYTFALATVEIGRYTPIGTCPVTVHEQVVSPTYELKTSIENCTVGADEKLLVDPENIEIKSVITGTSGLFDQYIVYQIYKGSTMISIYQPDVFVAQGQTDTIVWKTSLPNAVAGDQYRLVVKNARYQTLETIYFTIGEKSGIDSIGADDDTPAEYFNLQGQPVSSDNLVPGIYICRKGNSVSKILVK